jgi:hypothetical protein
MEAMNSALHICSASIFKTSVTILSLIHNEFTKLHNNTFYDLMHNFWLSLTENNASIEWILTGMSTSHSFGTFIFKNIHLHLLMSTLVFHYSFIIRYDAIWSIGQIGYVYTFLPFIGNIFNSFLNCLFHNNRNRS